MNKEQFIHIDGDGNKRYFSDRKMTIYHREDGPAYEASNGDREWLVDNKLHREDGPAVEWVCGHREWYINDKCHREDGPAIEWGDGNKTWCLNGEYLTEEQFNARMNPVE